MKKICLIILASLGIISGSYSQQEHLFTQYVYNKLVINPAYAGSRQVASFMGLYRQQWAGFKGAPQTQLLMFDSPFFNKRVGIGVTAYHNQSGIISSYYGSLAYSYDLINRENTMIRLGLQGSIRSFNIAFDDPDIYVYENGDPVVAGATNEILGNFGVGLYMTLNNFYFGASSPYLFQNILNKESQNNISAEESPHVYLMTGMLLPISKNVMIRPAILTKYVKNAPLDIDANVSAIFNNTLTIGANYRFGGDEKGFGESLAAMAFLQAGRNFGIGLAYDFTLTEINKFTTGSIEALLRYDLVSVRKDLANPRFFF